MAEICTDFCFGYANGMRTEHAFYELSQNLMDGVVECNGGTFNTVDIRKNDDCNAHLIEFFNESTRLAQIIQTPSSITFCNFDIVLDNLHPLTKMGWTSKRGKTFQSGQHGEGFKRATLRLLLERLHVRVVCLVGKEWLELKFDLNEKEQCMSYIVKKGIEAGPRPCLCVTVSWDTPEQKPPLLLNKWILSASAVVRDQVDESDPGTLLNGPAYNGNLYHWHLFIKHIPYMRFGYDCFMSSVPRDRHIVQADQVLHYVAAIASRSILEEDGVGASLFYEEICCKDAEAKTMESNCLKLLSAPARHKLTQVFRKKNPGKFCIRNRQKISLHPQYSEPTFVVLPDHVIDCFETVNFSLNAHLQLRQTLLLDKVKVWASKELQHAFDGICRVAFTDKNWSGIHYAMHNRGDCFMLVLNHTEAEWKTKGIAIFTQVVVPDLVRNSKLVIKDVPQFMYRLMQYFGVIPKEPNTKRHKKETLLPLPPPGYAYYDGPPFLVKIEK